MTVNRDSCYIPGMTGKGHTPVVEDLIEIRRMLAPLLRKHGFEVALAEGGEGAEH